MIGGNKYYYELFKTIDGGNQPQSLYFTYSYTNNIQQNISVDICICDEIYKEQCLNNENTKCAYNKEKKNLYFIKLKKFINHHAKIR